MYSATVTIALIITGALLGTTHTSVTCAGDGTGVQVTHYSIVDESQDSVEGEGSEEPFKWLKYRRETFTALKSVHSFFTVLIKLVSVHCTLILSLSTATLHDFK